ncbi:MAG: hypothetical protein ACKV2V_21305 [Blastocatellia bacterium]
MAETLRFAIVHQYDTRQSGITVDVVLQAGERKVQVVTKLDTGASYCIFGRTYGELLGLDIESGIAERIGTPMGSFDAFGHVVTVSALGIEMLTTVYFAADESFTRNVPGRQGWLDRVRLGLIDYEGRLFLSEYNDPEI